VEVKELVAEVLSETFEVEARLPRTLLSVAVRPGHYLGAYLDGKRRSFASPLRFYLLMLFLTALVFGFAGNNAATHLREAVGADYTVHITSTGLFFQVTDPPPPLLEPALASLEWFPELACPPFATDLGTRMGQLGSVMSAHHTVDAAAVLLVQEMLQQIPIVMTLLVGGYFLILKLLAWRTHTTVHLLCALVVHTLAMVALDLWALVPNLWVACVVFVWLQVHVVGALRVAYPGSWLRTALLYSVGGVLWFILVNVAFFLMLVLALMSMTAEYVS
jgi:hypothetical protein